MTYSQETGQHWKSPHINKTTKVMKLVSCCPHASIESEKTWITSNFLPPHINITTKYLKECQQVKSPCINKTTKKTTKPSNNQTFMHQWNKKTWQYFQVVFPHTSKIIQINKYYWKSNVKSQRINKPKKKFINCCPHALTKPPQKNYPSNPWTSTKSNQKGKHNFKVVALMHQWNNRTQKKTKTFLNCCPQLSTKSHKCLGSLNPFWRLNYLLVHLIVWRLQWTFLQQTNLICKYYKS